MSESERKIVNEKPDFDNQLKILEEEKKEIIKKRKMYILFLIVLIFSFGIFIFSYATLHAFREYGDYFGYAKKCQQNLPNPNVISYINKDVLKYINLPLNNNKEDECKPEYNIDYFKNGRPTFNLDIYGNKTYIFNKMNQMNKDNYCTVNCDIDGDGWPDYNIDLNGDGILDLNIMKDIKSSTYKCDLNCDINFDELPDYNIDTNGDGIADVNILDDTGKRLIRNIDYLGNRVPTFNIGDGTENIVNDASKNKKCNSNCDIDGDGWPDYNIHINGVILNELIDSSNDHVAYRKSKPVDWKQNINLDYKDLNTNYTANKNLYINIDVNGDGIPDLNISTDGGKTMTNKVDSSNKCKLNCDLNEDGFADTNIDLNGDGKADLNIVNKDNACIKNCDTNNDGRDDYLVDVYNNGLIISSIHNINIDNDYDTLCDYNCDTNNDLIPDYNIDTNNDTIPNINIDYRKNKTVIFNEDINHDGYPDKNIDIYGIGVCNFNCGETNENTVNFSNTCIKNCDTDNNGMPDMNVDIDNDGTCDFNCDNNTTKLDKDNDYFLDSNNDIKSFVIKKGMNQTNHDFSIKISNIEPGWNGKYILYIKNDSPFAVNYDMYWNDINNTFKENSMIYLMSRNNMSDVENVLLPNKNFDVKKGVIIKNNTTIKYVISIDYKNEDNNQIENISKIFKGELIARVN